MTGKIVFVCGHSNWGKSETLAALTDWEHRKRWTEIDGVDFWVKRMSNDDRPKEYFGIMGRLDPASEPHVLAAMCPEFESPKADPSELLTRLRDRGYRLYFWVMEHQYGRPYSVTADQIARLKTFGDVDVFSRRVEAEERAAALRAYIRRRVLS